MHPQVEQVGHARQEVAGEALGVEGDHVAAEQAVEQRVAQRRRQHPPGVSRRPRDVHEVADDGVGAGPSYQVSDEVEVVVLQQHDRLAVASLDLLDHRIREGSVDRDVAVLEGLVGLRRDVRLGRKAIEAVLDEPEQRVGDLAVERVVRDLVHFDVAH